MVINGEMKVLQFRGETGPYLRPAPGKPDVHLLKMLRDGLLVPVRSAIQEAKKRGGPVRREGVRVRQNGSFHLVNLLVMPLTQLSPDGPNYLVLFEPATPIASKDATILPPTETGRKRKVRDTGAEAPRKAESLRNLRLEEELAATREYLQAMIDQQESSNEELQSANEEIQSSNEELQSINDDLGASREELQANNEELQTLNEELHTRIRREEEAREYADAIIETMSPLLVLDQDLRVSIVNSAFCDHFNVTPQETANRLVYDLGNGQWNIPELRILLEDILPRSSEFKEYEVSHTFESLGPRTMLLGGRRVEPHPKKIFLSIHNISVKERGAGGEIAAQ